MLKTDRSFHRRWEIVLADDKTSTKKPPFHIRHFLLILVLLGVLGGFLALTVPLWKSWTCVPFLSSLIPANSADYSESKAIADLRLHILYITGGIIAILTLLQTAWKNQIDHRKAEDDIQKNKNDHNRQVHAERRSRYTKAVEQLANEKATVRLGGIYTLVGLVDEWLADDSLAKDKQQEEGQVIINNLCSYIRSPFPLAEKIEEYEARKELEKLQKSESEKLSEEASSRLQILLKRFKNSDEYEEPKDITADYAKFHEEQDVRRTIFVEMSKRSSILTKDEKNGVFKANPETWSRFQFDFSRAPVFYPLNNLKVEKGNFSSAKFYSGAGFKSTIFLQSADFKSATFAQKADFKLAVFVPTADFMRATFAQTVNFNGAIFNHGAIFSWAAFAQTADFRSAVFTQSTFFSWAIFTQTADFMRATFTQTADFMRATFTQTANFRSATFTQMADFRKATFIQVADFCKGTFTKNVDFSDVIFKNYEPIFVRGTLRARFSVRSAQEDYRFEVSESHRSIETEQITVAYPKVFTAPDPKVFTIPSGCELFDPEPLPAPKPEEKPTE